MFLFDFNLLRLNIFVYLIKKLTEFTFKKELNLHIQMLIFLKRTQDFGEGGYQALTILQLY